MRVFLETTAGDYHFVLRSIGDGRYECVRTLVDDPAKNEEVIADWSDLPETVRKVFSRVQNQAS
jgi:hypothetical protein